MLDRFLDNAINKSPRTPFKNSNPHEIPKGKSFYQWMKEINEEPTKEELIDEKIHFDTMLSQI